MIPLYVVLAAALGTAPDAGTPDGGAPAAAAAGDTLADGEALFSKLQCAVCHSLQTPTRTAPSLQGRFGGTTTLRDGSEHPFDEAYVRESILTPGAKVARGFLPIMPPFQGRLTEAELQSLVAFVRSLAVTVQK